MSALAILLAAQLSAHAPLHPAHAVHPPLGSQPAQGAYGTGLAYLGGFRFVNQGTPVEAEAPSAPDFPPPCVFVAPEYSSAPPPRTAPFVVLSHGRLRATEAKIIYLHPSRKRRTLHIIYGAG